jgi:hypothetical protein
MQQSPDLFEYTVCMYACVSGGLWRAVVQSARNTDPTPAGCRPGTSPVRVCVMIMIMIMMNIGKSSSSSSSNNDHKYYYN